MEEKVRSASAPKRNKAPIVNDSPVLKTNVTRRHFISKSDDGEYRTQSVTKIRNPFQHTLSNRNSDTQSDTGTSRRVWSLDTSELRKTRISSSPRLMRKYIPRPPTLGGYSLIDSPKLNRAGRVAKLANNFENRIPPGYQRDDRQFIDIELGDGMINRRMSGTHLDDYTLEDFRDNALDAIEDGTHFDFFNAMRDLINARFNKQTETDKNKSKTLIIDPERNDNYEIAFSETDLALKKNKELTLESAKDPIELNDVIIGTYRLENLLIEDPEVDPKGKKRKYPFEAPKNTVLRLMFEMKTSRKYFKWKSSILTTLLGGIFISFLLFISNLPLTDIDKDNNYFGHHANYTCHNCYPIDYDASIPSYLVIVAIQIIFILYWITLLIFDQDKLYFRQDVKLSDKINYSILLILASTCLATIYINQENTDWYHMLFVGTSVLFLILQVCLHLKVIYYANRFFHITFLVNMIMFTVYLYHQIQEMIDDINDMRHLDAPHIIFQVTNWSLIKLEYSLMEQMIKSIRQNSTERQIKLEI